VVRNAAIKTESAQLIPQAIIRDRDTFVDVAMQPPEKQLRRSPE
jgi:hypothetical protein